MSKKNSKKLKENQLSTKINKRSTAKYPALNKSLNLKSRTHLIDFDYLHLLGPEELEFLNKFVEEEINASFDKKNKNNLNKKIKDKRRCYQNNNKRNADVLVKQQAMKKIKQLDEVVNVTFNPEEQLNARIELKRMGVLDSEGKRIRKRKARI